MGFFFSIGTDVKLLLIVQQTTKPLFLASYLQLYCFLESRERGDNKGATKMWNTVVFFVLYYEKCTLTLVLLLKHIRKNADKWRKWSDSKSLTQTASLSLLTPSHYQLSVSCSATVKTNPHPPSLLFGHYQLLVFWQAVIKQNLVLCPIDNWQYVFPRAVKSVCYCQTRAKPQWPTTPIIRLWWQDRTAGPCE